MTSRLALVALFSGLPLCFACCARPPAASPQGGASGIDPLPSASVKFAAYGAPVLPAGSAAGVAGGAPSRGGVMVRVKGGASNAGPTEVARDHAAVSSGDWVDDFWIDRTEVTAGAYRECQLAGKCSPPGEEELCNGGVKGKENHPINCVDFFGARAFCEWAGKRLPTEAEWEHAAKGGREGRAFPWGSAEPTDQLCWKRWAKKEGTCAAGAFSSSSSRDGALDLAGNVWEWTCTGVHGGTSQRGVCDGESTAPRAVRGGSWIHATPVVMRATNKHHEEPGRRATNIGFRCAWSAP